MMSEKSTKNLLKRLPQRLAESVPTDLGQKIKQQIPQRLLPHRWGGETVNIIVHLRISRLTAVAAIVLTLVLCVQFFSDHNPNQNAGLYDEVKVLLNLLPGTEGTEADFQASFLKGQQDKLVSRGIDVVYFENAYDKDSPQTLLMYWKLPSGQYSVIYRDLRKENVSPEKLIKLQADMIRQKDQ